MSKRGRKSIYDTVILPNLDKIGEWVRGGATEKQICEALGISVSAFNVHKEKTELKETLKKNRINLVLDLRGELARQAFKHTLKTTKRYITKDDSGREKTHTEITEKEVDGDVGAIHLLMKNLDRDNWKDNWDNYEFRKQELELKKMAIDNSKWE